MRKTFKKTISLIIPSSLARTISKYRIKRYSKKTIKGAQSCDLEEYENYICKWYYERTGFKMDFNNPVTFTQKQQWLKLYDYTSKKTVLSDKYLVRNYVKEKLGTDENLVPLISIDGKDHFNLAEEIDFNKLPNAFVIKCNHGSGYNLVIKNKKELKDKDIKRIKRTLNSWLKEKYAFKNGLELVYRDIKPTIIIEKYIEIDGDLPDYKFLCFSGKIAYVWVDQGRYYDHRRTVFNLDFSVAPFNFHTYKDVLNKEKPKNYNKMLEIVQKLCENHAYVRVDLYNVNGHIYFSELTFSSSSGGELPNPIEYDRILGDLIEIDKSKRENNYIYRKR